MSHTKPDSDWDIFKDLKKQRQEENAIRLRETPAILTKAGIKWKSFNDGQHLVFKTKSNREVALWPSTGKWCYGTRRGGGLEYLLDLLKRTNEI